MPPLTDKGQIRAILGRNPRWCVYALGDLTPRMFEKCQWFTPDLTMVLHDYGTSILIARLIFGRNGAASPNDSIIAAG